MSGWELIWQVLIGLVPLLLLITAMRDWRRTRRNRYLVVVGIYLLVLVGWIITLTLPGNRGGMVYCGSAAFWLLVGLITQQILRRLDRASQKPSAKIE